MKINYHGWKAFKSCPKKYYKEFVKKESPTVPVNDYFALYGRTVEKFFELFCNNWRHTTPFMWPDVLRKKLEIIYDEILYSSTVNWSAPFCKQTKEQIFEQSYEDISNIMNSLNQNYFLNTRSEINFELKLKNDIIIKSRIDFIHKDAIKDEETIIDGKGTNKIGKNVDPDQLFFYTLVYLLHYNKLPKEIGFFYYKFNTFEPIPFNINFLNEFRAQLSLDIKTIRATTEFKATPCPQACKYCKYNNTCSEGILDKSSRMKDSKITDLDGDGIIEFGI